MARLEIRLLGSFEAALEGDLVTDFETNAARALLAYLAADPGHARPRPSLAEMLWPDRPEGAALSNLRHVLSMLRRALGDRPAEPTILLADSSSLALAASEDVWVDLAEFERLAQTPADAPDANEEWKRAVDLWRGPLLDGLRLRAGAEWEEWLVITAERLRRLLAVALRNLAAHYERQGLLEQAVATVRRLTEVDPWDERTHRQLMRLLAGTGESARALAHFADLEEQLRAELGAEPAPGTLALADQIRAGDLTGAVSEVEIAYPAFLSTAAPPLQPVFVDRRNELDLLRGHLGAALAGPGRMVFVAGEAGTGKTMLVTEFMRRATEVPDLLVARGRCNAFGGLGDPYLPFRELLGLLCGDVESNFTAGALDHEQATRLWEAIPHSARLIAELSPSLVGVMVNGPLLAERIEQAAPGVEWTAELRARIEVLLERPPVAERLQPALFDEYTRVLERLAITRPLLLVLDDLQWADRGSIALLWHLARRIGGMRVLVVGAYRPEDIIPAREDPFSLDQVLRELAAANPDGVIELTGNRDFVDELLDSEPSQFEAEFRDHFFSYTSGHPLFSVELLRGMQERGEIHRDRAGVWRPRGAVEWNRLPSRVESVIAQRLARLPEPLQRDLAIASVQGEEFVAEVVSQVGGDADAPQRLSRESSERQRLIEPSGVARIGDHVVAEHRFRHVLFQRYLYERLDEAERMRLHEATARALEDLYGDRADLPVVDLARHFDAAGLNEPAIDYLHQAGQRALQMSAAEEAIRLLERARHLLASLPESTERDERELALLGALFAALMSARGYASPEAEEIGPRVRGLCDRLEPSPMAALSLVGLATVLSLRSHYAEALATSLEARGISEALGDVAVSVAAYQTLGYNQTWMGDLAAGHANLQHASGSYDPVGHRWLVHAVGTAVGPDAMVWDAVNTLHRGYPDQAADLADRAVATARDLGHPFTLCHVLAAGEIVRRHFGGDFSTSSFIEEVETIARSEHFPFYEGVAEIYRGWAAGYLGDPEAGIESLTRGLGIWQAIGIEAFRGSFLAHLAWFEQLRGNETRAQETIDHALRLAVASGEGLGEMIARLVGARLEVARDEGLGAKELSKYVETARGFDMRLFEVQAATELALLHLRHDDRLQAEKVLAPVYSWFTEGFETPHLVAARSVLEQL